METNKSGKNAPVAAAGKTKIDIYFIEFSFIKETLNIINCLQNKINNSNEKRFYFFYEKINC